MVFSGCLAREGMVVIDMDPGEGLLVDMVDYLDDPWQGLNIFSSPEITKIPSPKIVQNTLEKLLARTETRVSDSPPEEGLLGLFTAQPLNLALGGAP